VARNYITALQEGGRSANTIRQAKVVLGAMFGMAVADGYLDYNPFHDVKIPKAPGRRAIKITTPEQYLKVRACLWARDYGRERMRVRRAAASGEVRRRWEKSRDADEAYLDEPIWNRIWARAVLESGIPFKPTAYQVRHTHASWLIDAGENPKAVMHRLGQADLRTTARYVHVLDETGESAARRFEGLLPPL
jgi:site-specific recombinase XerD